MIEIMKKLTLSLYVLTTLSGCATGLSADPGEEEHVLIDAKDKSRTRNIVITLGGILLLGAIIANEAGDNAEDAVRDAARP